MTKRYIRTVGFILILTCICAFVLLVVTGCSKKATTADLKREFFYGCAFYPASKVDELLRLHPELVKARDSSGQTGLYHAISSSNTDVIDLLLRRGADVNAKDSYGTTPLNEAAIFGKANVIRRLIAAGADANILDDLGYSPLYIAVIRDNSEVVKLLVQAGADVNLPFDDTGSMTPLSVAEDNKNKEIVAFLRQHGAVKQQRK